MNTSLAQRQQELSEQITSEEQQLVDLHSDLQKVDSELADLEPQRQQFHLLGVVCESLDQLNAMGCASLFWGEGASAEHDEKLLRSRSLAEEFNGRLNVLDSNRSALLDEIQSRQEDIGELNYHLDEITEELENSRYDFVIERDPDDEKLFRAGVMPWSHNETDRRRLRKAVLVSLLFMLVIGGVPRIWEVPPRDPDEKIEIPERLARMVRERAPPKPVEKPVEKPEEKKADEPKPDEPKVAKEKPKPEEVKKARTTASRKGVLAHSSMFEELQQDDVLSNLGSDAKVSGDLTSGGAAGNGAAGSRDMIAATAGNSGAAAAVGRVSRGGVGNGGGQAISGSGVATGSVKSEVASRVKETARPLSDGAGPSRTDEEIQIVFDRYKSSLYRLYNRELRNNPSLRGQMVLALTIEPDGSVSACRVKSTDLDSPALAANVVARVKLFNFGAKEGVPTTKITYPIDFLPAG